VLLGRPGTGAPVSLRPAEQHDVSTAGGGAVAHPGGIQGLFDLATAHRRLLRDGGSHLLVTDPAARRGPTAFTLTAEANAPERNETNHAHH
jgi:hypothetical protein